MASPEHCEFPRFESLRGFRYTGGRGFRVGLAASELANFHFSKACAASATPVGGGFAFEWLRLSMCEFPWMGLSRLHGFAVHCVFPLFESLRGFRYTVGVAWAFGGGSHDCGFPKFGL